MIHSVIVVYIVLGNDDEMDNNITENPSIGLFRVRNIISQRYVWCLTYSTDKIRGKDAAEIRATQGFLPPDGIGTINERADFKFGGGKVLQSGPRFKLRNTGRLKTTLNSQLNFILT